MKSAERQGLDALLEYYPEAEVMLVHDQGFAAGRGPWVVVDLFFAIGGTERKMQFAIWKNTGNVYRVGGDSAVEDDPLIEINAHIERTQEQ